MTTTPKSQPDLAKICRIIQQCLDGLPIGKIDPNKLQERIEWVLFGQKCVWAAYQMRIITREEAANKLLAEVESWSYEKTNTDYHGTPDQERAQHFLDELIAAM